MPSETLIVYVDGEPLDVAAIYRAHGFTSLPPTPTATVQWLRTMIPDNYGRRLWTSETNGYPERELADHESVPVKHGDRFYSVPEGTFGSMPEGAFE